MDVTGPSTPPPEPRDSEYWALSRSPTPNKTRSGPKFRAWTRALARQINQIPLLLIEFSRETRGTVYPPIPITKATAG